MKNNLETLLEYLMEEERPMVLYHGTLRDSVGSILSGGLKAGGGWGGAAKPGVFLSPTPEDASYWAKMTLLRKRLDDYIKNPHPFINKIADLVHNNDLNTGDLVSDYFGKTADGRIVLIDYGLTEDVAQEYY